MVIDWRELSPAAVLAEFVVLDAEQVAYVLNLPVVKGARVGKPDPRRVVELVERHKLRPVDPAQPETRWTFSRKMVEAYLENQDRVLLPQPAAVMV